MDDCVFCKIVAGEIPADIKYEDENILVFTDVNPQAPVHLLVIPKKHIENILDLENDVLLAQMFAIIKDLAPKFNLKNGFRLVNNCGKQAGQTVSHLHFHVLGGRRLGWPPG